MWVYGGYGMEVNERYGTNGLPRRFYLPPPVRLPPHKAQERQAEEEEGRI